MPNANKAAKNSKQNNNVIDLNTKLGHLTKSEETIVRHEIQGIIAHPQMRKILEEELGKILTTHVGKPRKSYTPGIKIPHNKLLTTHMVGRLLQMDPSSIVKWVNEKKLPAYTTPGGHRRIRVTDLVIFIGEHGMLMPDELVAEVPVDKKTAGHKAS